MRTAPAIATLCLSHSPPDGSRRRPRARPRVPRGICAGRQGGGRLQPDARGLLRPGSHARARSIAPCFTVVESATGYGDWGTPQEDYAVPRQKAIELARYLAEAGIDIATADTLRLDHGFGQSTADLFGSLSSVPILPIVINCVDRPIATVARVAALGRAVGEWLRMRVEPDERVLVIGSGGLSHAPPSLIPGARDLTEEQRRKLVTDNIAKAAEAIDPDWDRDLLDVFASDWERLASLREADLVAGGSGGAEVRTWIASVFTGGTPLEKIVYQPVSEWITGMGIVASTNLAVPA
ncbi:3-carboxyethylcatechol 2,3-dioxygenase [Mycolicibacterium sp. 120266]|uniref:DODA-type extradiol aromatic ring-opening family dioxygenase n=1 Tax=Mycolicibacterium sp. 120266 TaxID=3090601 RepID=UPI00299D1B14|nr:3-carboxyethylcatechol 2,3-dioxygenase [Mycolicibacterium sp. 120266]MDX1874121.1 3-carboxyethylcatechol 2,3-dioxygenase [Mycolicibacterium sp. 120266]